MMLQVTHIHICLLETPKAPENFTISKVLLQNGYRNVEITWKWDPNELIKYVRLVVNPPHRGIKFNHTQTVLSLDYQTRYMLEVTGRNCAGEGATSNPFTIRKLASLLHFQ